MNKNEIKLNKADKQKLNNIIKKGVSKAREITRARVLLFLENKKSAHEISETLGCTKKTVYNIKNKYLEGGIARAIYDSPRPGPPNKFNGKHRAKITALACTEAPEGYAKWSLSLLSDKAVEAGIVDEISPAHVGRILKKTR